MILSYFHLPFYLASNYYQDAKINPQYGAVPILIIVLAAQELFLFMAIRTIQDPYANNIGIPESGSRWAFAINLILGYFLYIKDNKPIKVYNYYKDKPWANKKSARVLNWIYILLSILAPFLFIIVRNAATGRHLV